MSFRVVLVSMPWPLANRPSIQLGALKSYLQKKLPHIKVICIHTYLEVANTLGLHIYNSIAEKTWIAEAVYSYILNPELRVSVEGFFSKKISKSLLLRDVKIEELAEKIISLHNQSSLWKKINGANLVGVSVCLSQLSSSLFLAKELKLRSPETKIVFGGSGVAGSLGKSLIMHLPEIDFVVTGEGEIPLAEIVKILSQKQEAHAIFGPGIFYRDANGNPKGMGCRQVKDLDALPTPDFRDYFLQLKQLSSLKNFIPSIPIEASRGCWWHQVTPTNPKKACQFCNLNLQWKGYRHKSLDRVSDEIESHCRRYATTRFFFVDNTLPPSSVGKLFDRLESHGRSYEIFLETRATVSKKVLQKMRRAGVTEVQVGIEGLSSSFLRKIHKGSSAIRNIETMKYCEELDINNLSNILIGFPGSDEKDVEETLSALDFVLIYKPLRIVRFWLGYQSPIYLRSKEFGIRNIRNHPNYRYILPQHLVNNLELMQKDYSFDKVKQKRLWKPVVQKVKEWKKYYRSVKEVHPQLPILHFKDGKDFLVITRASEKKREMEALRLRDSSRSIYKFCDQTRSLETIHRHFPKFSKDTLKRFLDDLVVKKVMFREKNRYLSLAVNADIRRFDP